MNNIFARRSCLLSLAALAQLSVGIAIIGSGLSAQAETMNKVSTNALVEAPIVDASATPLVESTAPANDTQRSLQQAVPATTAPQQLEQTTPTQEAATTPAPVPGTTATSAAPLTSESPVTPQQAPASETTEPSVAQTDIDPGQPTRGGSSYVGVAGNIGLSGESALADFSFTVISKIGLTSAIAARPSVVIGDDAVILIPVTYDFSLLPVDAFEEAIPLSPYVGAGVAISTGNESDFGPMLTAGVDLPITNQFTATAAVNLGFLEDTDVGLLIGIGYNFTGLGF